MAIVWLPASYQDEQRKQASFGELYRQWAQVRNAREHWEPINVRFQHNPNWREGFSIDYIANDRGPIVRAAKIGAVAVLAAGPLMLAGWPFLIAAAAVVTWDFARNRRVPKA